MLHGTLAKISFQTMLCINGAVPCRFGPVFESEENAILFCLNNKAEDIVWGYSSQGVYAADTDVVNDALYWTNLVIHVMSSEQQPLTFVQTHGT